MSSLLWPLPLLDELGDAASLNRRSFSRVYHASTCYVANVSKKGPEQKKGEILLYTVGRPLSRDVLFCSLLEVLLTNRAAQ